MSGPKVSPQARYDAHAEECEGCYEGGFMCWEGRRDRLLIRLAEMKAGKRGWPGPSRMMLP